MAQISYRANLSAAVFPMSLSRASGSVIIPGPDQNYDRRLDPTGEQKTPGIPQAIYLENVLPSVEGYQSVGYVSSNPLPFPATEFVILEVKRPDGHWPILMAFRINTVQVYFYQDIAAGWVEIPSVGAVAVFPADPSLYFTTVIAGNIVIWVDGSSYLYTYGGSDVLTYNNADYTPSGVLDDVVCVLSSYNYYILVKNTPQGVSVLWSSLLAPFNFVPSLVTGSGGGQIITTQGNAVSALPCPEGFYVYTKNNIIFAIYTGNSRYPFKFIPVKDSQGISTSLDVYSDLDESAGLVFTRQGQFHIVSSDRAQQVAPELSEFLERANTYDSYDKVNNVVSTGRRPLGYRKVRPYAFGSRYLCVSIKETSAEDNEIFDAVIILDKLLNRYGKLKFQHTRLFTYMEYKGDLITGIRSDRLVLGAIDANTREVIRWTFVREPGEADLSPAINHNAVLILGRFQYARSREICVDEIVLEGSDGKNSPDTTVAVFPSRLGKSFDTPQIPHYVADASDNSVRRFYSTAEGRNVSLAIKGSFELSNVELVFHLGASV